MNVDSHRTSFRSIQEHQIALDTPFYWSQQSGVDVSQERPSWLFGESSGVICTIANGHNCTTVPEDRNPCEEDSGQTSSRTNEPQHAPVSLGLIDRVD